jgi:hypothetical protein
LFCSVPWNGGNSSHHSPLLGYPAKNTYSQTTILSPTRRTWHAHIMVNTSSDQQRQPNHQTHLVRGCKFINRLLRHAPALPFQDQLHTTPAPKPEPKARKTDKALVSSTRETKNNPINIHATSRHIDIPTDHFYTDFQSLTNQ